MCTHPIKLKQHLEHGITTPCGFCIECRSRYARMWAIRCVHEASLHAENCFGTLTYSDEFLPEHGSLDRKAFPLFMKRLRKSIEPRKVKFYHAGEYGSVNFRPHYHFLLFGYMPAERVAICSRGEYPLYTSSELEALWPFGLSSCGEVSFSSASYVARYVMKKVDQVGRKPKYSCDPETGEMHEIEREYSTMSRGGRSGRGLGHGWYSQFGEEVERLGSVRMEGAEMQPPRYYDELLRERDEAAFEVMKLRRMRKFGRVVMYKERMAREVIARQRLDEAQRRI